MSPNRQVDRSDRVREATKNFGLRLKAERMMQGLTMSALSSACGYSEALICKLEKGRTSPSLSALICLAEALDVAPASMLEPASGR